ncbi:DNA repair and recombination protein RadB [Methanococcus maripaludis]|jgi:DNA repair protein RadB|uniref:DNA repair and recombination protein RadB n=6 Tax=Methanococcus maripaludis TaxID=39152 RepID=RADB_METMP|nr:DNA repair and recombination protein RadB [Methanococcus maripaludis]P0CW60.1 RecName: Full=DNA repair and recombination protein RadB [Methanococcus maripaludis]P0CW61.1 RecName: Full=DNA repair and recombination protein RadB [Methanococcus maripaludis S2]MDK2929272.1 repair protein RadB [Methanococcus sp.]AAB88382.1 DNA repair protein [Methanococcus maripaludis]AEK19556.1 DNA repair and recombination protein RadB [Methanococcus maripaludis X1]AVB75783.1 DNA repair and recombination protei
MLEELLNGNIEKKTITQIYGPPGVGKTNICIISMLKAIENGKNVVYIDTEGSLSIERIKQLSGKDCDELLKNIIIYEPSSFEEQSEALEKIFLLENVGLIIIDGIVSLYRLELCDKINENTKLNRMLGKQISNLLKVSRQKNSGILITNQVKDSINGIEPAGGRLLEYWSKSIIKIEKSESIRKLTLEKHRHAKEGENLRFKILQNGLEIINKSYQ